MEQVNTMSTVVIMGISRTDPRQWNAVTAFVLHQCHDNSMDSKKFWFM